MAEDKAILTVSLKEYKKSIDDLRASLLSLEETDEQYVKTANEVQQRQTKLNQVMSIGKKNADALDGSYNALVNEMSKLKRAWRETADEAKRADLGQRILEINNQLKDMDASIGNFQRNVGNYGGAFEEAFKKMAGGMKGVGGQVGNTIGMIGQLVPLIKKASQAAVVGCQGVKAALISTGIGALIVALTTIIANWDSIRDAIFGTNEEMERALNLHNEYLNKQEEVLDNMSRESKLMAARGSSQKEILLYQKEQIKALLAEVNSNKVLLAQEAQRILNHSWLRRMIMGEDAKLQDMTEELKKMNAESKALQKRLDDINTDIEVEDIKASKGQGKTGITSRMKEEKSYIDETLKRLKNFGKEQLDILKSDYEEQSALLTAEYNKNKKKKAEYEEAMKKLTEEYAKARKEILEGEVNQAISTIDRLNKLFDTEYDSKKIEENYAKGKDALTKAMNAEIELFGKSEEEIARIKEKYNKIFDDLDKERLLNHQKVSDKIVEEDFKRADKSQKEMMDKAINKANYEYDMSGDGSEDAQIAHIQKVWELQMEYINWYIDENKALLESELLSEEEKDKIRERVHQAEMKRLEQTRKKNLDINKARVKDEKKSWKDIVQVAAQGAQALAGIMNSVASLWQDDIKRKQEDGEISEEEARNQFERTKKVQYGAAVLNTAAGIVTAIATAQKLGPPMGPIVGAINAAAVAAAGAIQIAQIAKQSYDSAGSGGGGTSPIIIPPQATYQETSVTNPTERDSIDALNETLQNQTVTVKVTDIEKVEGRKKATVSESSW